MGFPVVQKAADAYGCQTLDVNRLQCGGHVAVGNSMHVPNAAMVIATMLLSVKLSGPQELL